MSDGADNVRDLQFLMHPESEHILDWLHITMRLTVLNQFAKGMCHIDPDAGAELLKKLDSAKWRLWHGNAEQALERLDDCYWLCDDPELRYEKRRKLVRHLSEMMTYIGNNSHLIPNYGEKYPNMDVIDNRAVDLACYHPGFTLVEKLQTIATKYRQQQQSGDMPKKFMRHYYDVACLLDNNVVKPFIGSEDYHAHKATRFPQEDFKISLDENEAFLFSDPNTRALCQENYEATSEFYYKSQPSFQSLLNTILNVIQKL
jgi:hypothetical protein